MQFQLVTSSEMVIPQTVEESVNMLLELSEKMVDEVNELKTVLMAKDEEYQVLEQAIQKGENEIRMHIRLEQQMKLYVDSIQAKLDETEKLSSEKDESNKQLLQNNQQINQDLQNQLSGLKQEIDRLMRQNNQSYNENGTRSLSNSQYQHYQSQIVDSDTGRSLPKMNQIIPTQSTQLPTSMIRSQREEIKALQETDRQRERIIHSITQRQSQSNSRVKLQRAMGSQQISQNVSQEHQSKGTSISQHNNSGFLKVYTTNKALSRRDSQQSKRANIGKFHHQSAAYQLERR